MAIVGAPSSDLVNAFVAPGRFLPDVLSPQIPRHAPLEQPPSITTERFAGKMRGITSSRELVSQVVDGINDVLGRFKIGVGVSVESKRGKDQFVVAENASQTRIGELSARQLLDVHSRLTDAMDIPGHGLPTGLFINRAA